MDQDFFTATGKVWDAKDLPKDTIKTTFHQEIMDEIIRSVKGGAAQSVVLSGEYGTGKSTLIKMAAQQLFQEGWTIFQASSNDIVAGQRYIGDFEQNVKNIIEGLQQKKKSLWVVPRFHELYHVGKHEQNPVGALDMLLPYCQSGQIKIIGETHPRFLEKITQYRPQIRETFDIIRINGLDKEDTLSLTKQWMAQDKNQLLWRNMSSGKMEEVYYLAQQYLNYQDNPGMFFNVLKQTKSLLISKKKKEKALEISDFIEAIAQQTGLPKEILDERTTLDIDALQKRFSKHVIGQGEAINAIIDRVAMIKAGLTDPSRPLGVFLFVGPTGTGKTEIAKMLTQFLFSTEKKMVRLDMSEFQTADSVYRIIGDGNDVSENMALVNKIRKNPFSVVLLDEFEKAHPNIWDLFLQVFDDGRLTDQRGDVADFRQSIIIMTSNAGASIPTHISVGFNTPPSTYSQDKIRNTIEQVFRPEFINRIDRIVAFKPLSEASVRRILKNELKNVLRRRGLRRKKWAVEWEESALDFLMEKGYSSHLGARPMKRAIEQHLLAPLALTIVKNQYPDGDQFLFVKKEGNKLKVEFVDPDEPEIKWTQRQDILAHQATKVSTMTLAPIALNAAGELAEFEVLKIQLEQLDQVTRKVGLEPKKDSLLKQMSNPEFWSSEDRFSVLSEIEFIDRFQEGLQTARSLYERLDHPEKKRLSYPKDILQRLALRLIILQRASEAYKTGQPQNAFLRIYVEELHHGQGPIFLNRLIHMYQQWAKSRKMHFELLSDPNELLGKTFAISGFGAFQTLYKEEGIHSWDYKVKNRSHKISLKIEVVPQREINPKQIALSDMAKGAFEKYKPSLKLLRKYKGDPVKEIVDNRLGWRTSKPELVWSGNFDIMALE